MSGTADLYTGATGQDTFGNEQPTTDVTEVIEAQKAEIARLMPAAEDVLKIIEEEKKAIANIRAYITTLGPSPTKTQIYDEYRARELYIGFLDKLAGSIKDKIQTAEGATHG